MTDIRMEPKTFCDPIHQYITLPGLCVRIVDTPQFQRLRFIRQLGNAFFVYPGATHSRFEHSLGVCHLAGKLARKLLDGNNDVTRGIFDHRKHILAIQIAGLCHDLGHGPKSHNFEQFVNKIRKKQKKQNPDVEDWKHEEASEQLLDHIIEKNDLLECFKKEFGTEQETANYINFIKDCIRGKKKEKDESDDEKSFLYEIVANKETEIDVDKWDYFLRDCHMTGERHTFDHIRAIDTADVVKGVDGCTHIGWRDKEAYNLYEMFHTRARLHRLVYKHRVIMIIDHMEKKALKLARRALPYLKGCSIEETVKDMEVYSLLNDDVFNTILRLDASEDEKVREAQGIIRSILQRQIPKMIAKKNVHYDKIKKEEYETELKQRIVDEVKDVDKKKITVIVVKFDFCKGDKDPVAERVNFYTKDGKSKTLKQDEVSLMLPNAFAELEVRLYCDQTLLDQEEELIQKLINAFEKALNEW